MATTNVSDDFKSVLERISGMCFKVESCLGLSIDGFTKHKVGSIDEAKKVCQGVCAEVSDLIKRLTSKGADPSVDKELIKCMVAITGHIEMAISGMDSVLHHIQVKVTEGISFSDKGMSEITHILRESLAVMKSAGDTFLTKNEVLKKHVVDQCANLNHIVDAYSEEHENRLIKGICQPKSSSLYLNLVNSLMNVVWSIKRAVDRLFASR